jgi:AhpD family alkylhydroperoxidase
MNSNDTTKSPCSNLQPTDANTVFTEAVRELVAIGAAIAANCEPCFKFHYDKARKLGLSNEDMAKAVDTGTMVKNASASNIIGLANRHLGRTVPEQSACSSKTACCS